MVEYLPHKELIVKTVEVYINDCIKIVNDVKLTGRWRIVKSNSHTHLQLECTYKEANYEAVKTKVPVLNVWGYASKATKEVETVKKIEETVTKFVSEYDLVVNTYEEFPIQECT